VPIGISSQNTYQVTADSLIVITPEQLKLTNLIFNEHKYLKEKVEILNNEISNLEALNKTYVVQDSIRCKEIELYKSNYEDINKKYKRLNKKFKIVSISSIVAILGALIWR
jgi:hypothetical protein